jgi:quercetin dioxygenase-like cupin family protein
MAGRIALKIYHESIFEGEEEIMAAHLTRPFRPVELEAGALSFFELPELAADLRREEEYGRSGVAALTLARDEHATLVLVALRRGARMREHRAPSAATVVVLSGRIAFLVEREAARTELGAGALAAFAADLPHAVEAVEDAVYLVTIGGRPRSGA